MHNTYFQTICQKLWLNSYVSLLGPPSKAIASKAIFNREGDFKKQSIWFQSAKHCENEHGGSIATVSSSNQKPFNKPTKIQNQTFQKEALVVRGQPRDPVSGQIIGIKRPSP